MPKVNCAVVGCSSSTYRINKWKKEPCLEHGHKNVVKGQCPSCEKPYSLYQIHEFRLHVSRDTLMRDTRIQALKQEIRTEQNELQKAVMGFIHYTL